MILSINKFYYAGGCMFFCIRKNIVLVITIGLFISGCARTDNSWQVEKSYEKFESMLMNSPDYKSRTNVGQGLEQQEITISLTQKSDYKNSVNAMENNTVFILTKNDVGTGFFVAPGIIVTNKHVVQRKNARVIVFGKGLKTPQLAIVTALSSGEGKDYAILKMLKDNYGPSGLALCSKIVIAEQVSTWGFPLNLSKRDPKFKRLQQGDPNSVPEITYSEGIVNVVYKGTPDRILHTAETSRGNSGGPLANADYCVVGMTTLLYVDKKTGRETSVALGSEDIIKFLNKNGIRP